MRFSLHLMSVLIVGALSVLPSVHAAQQNFAAIRQAAETYAKQQTAYLSGQVNITVGAIEQAQLAPCTKLQAFLPLGAKLWGNSSIGVRCSQGAEWTVYVPVTVRVQAPVLVATRPLASGQQLTAADVTLQVAELTQLPAGVITTVQDAVGKVLSSGVVAGNPLRQDMLRAPILVRQGQNVRLVAQGQGFKVSSEGRALSNGAAGQQVQVKAQNGQTVSGIVQPDGTIEVQY
jgi:flagella basal body P-ring formation protein FlgA